MQYKITIANTKAEFEAVYRLRYRVFFIEGGDARYAEHDVEQWRDEDDGEFSRTLICSGNDGDVYGTIRLTFLRDHQFIACDAYDLRQLSSFVGIEEMQLKVNVGRVDRVAVAPSKRGTRVFFYLFDRVRQLASESCTFILVGAASVESSVQNKLWEKLGWKPYLEAESRGFRATVFYLDLREQFTD
jgi:hypothetical protein